MSTPSVDNRSLREAFESSGLTLSALARNLGHLQNGRRTVGGQRKRVPGSLVPDITPVSRALGLRPDPQRCINGKYYPPRKREKMRESTALRYAAALGLDPVDIGL